MNNEELFLSYIKKLTMERRKITVRNKKDKYNCVIARNDNIDFNTRQIFFLYAISKF